MRVFSRHTAITACIYLFCAYASHASALEPFVLDAPVKDAIVDPLGHIIYVVTDAPPQILGIDLRSGDLRLKKSLPHPGTKIVLDEGSSRPAILLPYNNAIAFVDQDADEIVVREVGENPTDISTLPSSGVGTSNSFSNSVSLINNVNFNAATSLDNVESLPNRITATENYLVVTTRVPTSLWTYSISDPHPVQKTPISETPLSLHSWTRDRILVHYGNRVEAIDLTTHQQSTFIDSSVDELATYGGRVFVMRGTELSVYDNAFNRIRSEDLGVSGKPIPIGQDLVAVIETKGGTLYLPELGQRMTQIDVSKPALDPEPIAVAEPKPIGDPEQERKINPVQETQVNPQTMVITREPVVAPGAPEYDAEVIREFEIAREQEESHSGKSKYAVKPGRTRLGGNRPHAPSLADKKPIPLSKAIKLSTSINTKPNSLFNIDTTQEPVVDHIDNWVIDTEKNRQSGTGGVAFQIDNAQIEAERFEQDDNTGILNFEENVHASTKVSDLTADKLLLRRFPPVDQPLPPMPEYPIVPFGYDLSIDDPMSHGSLEAFKLHLKEDDREFYADYVNYDSFNGTGELIKPHGHSGLFYFNAERIRILGPDQYDSEDLWITTCDLDDPHYRIRISKAELRNGEIVDGRNVRMQIGKVNTPLYIPRLSGVGSDGEGIATIDLKVGSRSELGAYVNYAQWYEVNQNINAAYRLYPTTKEGLGYGVNVDYNFMDEPTSPLFRSKGQIDTLYTTEERGYTHWYHRQSLGARTRLLAQWEQWYDSDFYKDFYNSEYENRTGPRTFANITHVREGSILTATASKSTHDFITETEKLPEGTLHILERPVLENLYLTMDTVVGGYRRAPSDFDTQRYSHNIRLSYDWNLMEGFNVVPFIEGSATHYSDTLADNDAETRWLGIAGATAQARFSKTYDGFARFSEFKHIIIPSVTVFDQNASSLDVIEVPRFGSIDARPSRQRVESKIDNIILGRNAYDDETWRVARLALYQGQDISSDDRESTDYEVDMELRPRPWWGFRGVGEHHSASDLGGIPGKDRNRVLSYLFYDDENFENSFNARLGFALTDVEGFRRNREILYGAGYKLSSQWSVSAEHRYDLDSDSIDRQIYELRRRLHKWEMGLRLQDRPSGTDLNIVFSLVDIAGTSLRF